MTGDTNWLGILIAVLGAGGIGAAIREIVNVFTLARKGVSGKEEKRRDDLVTQRDYAFARMKEAELEADAHEARADREAAARRQWQEEVARLRRAAIENGGDPGPWPDIDETTDPIRKKETPS